MGYGKGVFLAQLLGLGALGQPEGQEGQPWGRGRDIPRDTCYGAGTAFGGLRLPPRSPRDAKWTGPLSNASGPPPSRDEMLAGSRAEKGGPAGAPLPEGASPISNTPTPTQLTFRSFSGRYLQSRAISTYLSKSRGAILEITSPDGGGGGG